MSFVWLRDAVRAANSDSEGAARQRTAPSPLRQFFVGHLRRDRGRNRRDQRAEDQKHRDRPGGAAGPRHQRRGDQRAQATAQRSTDLSPLIAASLMAWAGGATW